MTSAVRETVARIVNPAAFKYAEELAKVRGVKPTYGSPSCLDAYARADAIITLIVRELAS